MHTEQNAPFLQLSPHKHTPLTHPTTTHEFIGGLSGVSQEDSNEVLKSLKRKVWSDDLSMLR